MNGTAGAVAVAGEQADVARAPGALFRRDIGSFLAENGSIDGAITCSPCLGSIQGGRERAARETTYASAVLDVGAEELPGALGPLVRVVETDVAAPDDVARRRRVMAAAKPGGLRDRGAGRRRPGAR